MDNLTINQMTITPDIAEIMLQFNIGNRRVKTNRVNEYADYMKNGEFRISTDCIGFDKNGILINGQHRLLACVKSGIPFEAIVAKGFEGKAFEVIDQGCGRTGCDVVKDSDVCVKNTTSLGVIRFLFCSVLGMYNPNEFGNIKKAHIANEYDGICFFSYNIKKIGGLLSTSAPTTTAMIAAVSNGVDMETIKAFVSVGKNEITSSLKYNNKAALDFIDFKSKFDSGTITTQKSIFEGAKRAIYLFSNNVKKTARHDFYPVTIDHIKALNEEFRNKGEKTV